MYFQPNIEYVVYETLAEKYLNKGITKQASIFSSLYDLVSETFFSMYDPERPFGSIANISLDVLLGFLGPFWLPIVKGVVEEYFHVDMIGLFETLKNKVVELLTHKVANKEKVGPSDVNATVESVLGSGSDSSSADDFNAGTYQQTKEAFRRFAYVYDLRQVGIVKNAGWISAIISKGPAKSFIVKLFKFLFNTIVRAFLTKFGAKIIAKSLGADTTAPKTNPLTGEQTGQYGRSNKNTLHQTSFGEEIKQDSPQDVWAEKITFSQFPNLLLDWAKKVYPDLQGHDDIIQNSQKYRDLIEKVRVYNKDNLFQEIYIPSQFHKIQDVVDYFIDDVASKLPKK